MPAATLSILLAIPKDTQLLIDMVAIVELRKIQTANDPRQFNIQDSFQDPTQSLLDEPLETIDEIMETSSSQAFSEF